MADYVDNLSDADLRTKLSEYGFPVMPITATTRKVMVKKLKLLIENRNKINSDGRRSLAKYSSEEESDTDTKTKEKNRRATIMSPPAAKTRKSTKKVEVSQIDSPASSTREVKSSRNSTRIIKTTVDADFETGSDSETEVEIAEKISISPKKQPPAFTSPKPQPSLQPTYNMPSSSSVGRTTLASPDYPAKQSYSTSRYSTSTSYSHDSGDSLDRLNQIRSRLSLSTNHERPSSSVDRKIVSSVTTNYGDGDAPSETPFLSNFTKRLSQLSNNAPAKPDFTYKNDIIKEHDANGSSVNRSYLSRVRNRDYQQDFRTSQEKNIFKNSVVSFALLGFVCVFFVVIALMYMGIRVEKPAVADSSDYVTPLCSPNDFISKPGINCLFANEVTDALNLLKVVTPELKKRALQHHCGDPNVKPYMTDNQIIDHVINNYAPRDPYEVQKAISGLQMLVLKNPKWGIAIIRTDNYPADSAALESMDQILENGHNKIVGLALINPDLPWTCVVYNKLYTILSSVLIIGIGFSTIFFGQKGYKYVIQQRKQKNNQIYSMVERIIDILQSNASDNSDNFLAVNHVRDMLIPPQERKQMTTIWNAAVKFLQENESRVRTEIQIVSGEEFHVWRWLGGSSVTGSPRSKTWQGQAFETQVGSVNSLPCSPTPCLKIRGMFDERERNLYTIREAVLCKCATKCQILHCDVDLNSSCVYLKCANQHEAAVAYRNLHGWWYDGRLVTVKYLRLERYMQRYPDSPAKGPPFLTSTSNQSLGNDWTSKDD